MINLLDDARVQSDQYNHREGPDDTSHLYQCFEKHDQRCIAYWSQQFSADPAAHQLGRKREYRVKTERQCENNVQVFPTLQSMHSGQE
jgi:hypothetical protein